MAIDNQKVAAVVVTFNRKNLLIECLNALISQTYKLTSIIIID
ncbi:MAG TPA: glycosyl transferase, partial [Thermoanaerobacter sp.]|nr:glycosyl transferase [Thermoanaerobacter sp.]